MILAWASPFNFRLERVNTVMRDEMSVWTLGFEIRWAQIKQICVIFTHLKLWVAIARHNFKWVKI